MSEPGAFSTVTDSEGFTVSSTTETAEQLTENLKAEPAPAEEAPEAPEKPTDPKLSKAAAELGKKGGEAAAAKRAAEKEAQEAETETVTETGKDADKPLGKPRDDPRARMLEATRKEAEAKRERDAAASRAERAEQRLAEIEREKAAKAAPAKEEAKPSAEAKPKAEDFENYEDFVEARARFAAREEFRERQKEATAEAQISARGQVIEKAVSSFNGRLEEALKATPDFKDRTRDLMVTLQPSFTLAKGQPLQPLNVVADEIINSEKSAALMLYLAEHPEEVQRLSVLRTPTDVQVEVRFIAKGLGAAPTATAAEPQVSKAHAPVRPVAGAPYTADAEPGEEASFDEHLRFHNSRERARR